LSHEFGPRPPPPTGPFLRTEIAALRRVVESIHYEPGQIPVGPTVNRPDTRALARNSGFDFFDRHYPFLYIAAKHGLSKREAVACMWGHLDRNQARLSLPTGGFVVLDGQDLADLARLRSWYPPRVVNHFISGAAITEWKVDSRVMERWACRASLRRVPALYDDLTAGFAKLNPQSSKRFVK
jgi:hypothetical protein